MKVIAKENLTYDILEHNIYFESIHFATDSALKLLDDTSTIDVKDAERVINLINNQNIYDLNLQKYSYKHMGKSLTLERLSRSERLFLMSYIADKKHIKCWFYGEIRCLTDSTLELYMKLFGRSEYVNIVINEATLVDYFQNMVGEITNE